MSDHLSISQIRLFKACRRAYELKYVYGFEPVETASALVTGVGYHEKLEELYKTGTVDTSDFSKESAMAVAYSKYVYPKFKMKSVEEWVRYLEGDAEPLIGRVDGITEDGMLVEHKTTSLDMNEYEYNLQWDEQVLAYMLMTGVRSMWYTICKKPTIRQRKGESEEEFFLRMVEWYDTDTEDKIRLVLIERSDSEVDDFRQEYLNIRDDISLARRYNDFYRNNLFCHMWGRRCEYSGICLNGKPDGEYVGFTRRENDA